MKLRTLLAATLLATSALGLAACSPAKKTETAAPAGGLAIPELKYEFRQLANGLRVYAMPDADTSNVSVQVWYDVGSKNDPAGRSGFAHLFEHLMFKSTSNMPPEFFDRLTEDAGGYNNASTWNDFTNYYEVVPANHLQRVLWGEAERMGSLVIDEANFKSERDVVKEEFRQSVLSQPYGKLFYLYLPQSNFSVHPYGRPGIGSIADLDSATVADVRAFHAAYYRPDNAVLVVSGKFDPAQLNGWIDQYFAGIKKPERAIPRPTAVESARTEPKNLTVYEPNVPLGAVMISYPNPDAKSPDISAWMALDAILTKGQSSRLYQSLVYDQKLASDVGSSFEVTQDAGAYALYSILSEGKSADEGLAALKAEIARLRDAPVSQAELDEARNELVTDALQSRETAEGRADELARSVIIYGNPKASDELLAKLQAVTAADIQRVANSILDDTKSVSVKYLPEELQKGAKEDTFADAATIQAITLDIPATEIPTYTLAAEGARVAPPAAGPVVAAKVPATSERELSNGLRVVVATRPGLPLVSATLRLPQAGASSDPSDRAGLASLTADLASRGTASRSATDISRQIESLGASISSGAGADSASVSIATRADKVDQVFEIMSDVVEYPAFADEELARARQETLDNLLVQLRQPSSIGRYAISRTLFGDGPYGRIASPRSIAAITGEDIKKFYARWRPDGAVLVITGDISAEAGFSLAERTLGDWTPPASEAPALPATVTDKPDSIVIDVPQIGQAAVLMGHMGPQRNDADYFPALVANDVLGGGYSARLNAEIRIKRGLSYGARAQLPARAWGAPIVSAAQTRNDAVPDVATLMGELLGGLGAQPIPAPELEARKSVLIGSFGRSVETTTGLAGEIASLAQLSIPLDRLASYPADIQAVTAEQAGAAARKYYDPASADVVVVGDAKVFMDKLKAPGRTFERIGIDKLNLDSATLK